MTYKLDIFNPLITHFIKVHYTYKIIFSARFFNIIILHALIPYISCGPPRQEKGLPITFKLLFYKIPRLAPLVTGIISME